MVTRIDTHLRERIVVDPKIMAGKPTVKGTRIPVDLVLAWLADEWELDGLFQAYPRLTIDDVRACIEFAREAIADEAPRRSPT